MDRPICIAGPCAAESEQQLLTAAEMLQREVSAQGWHLDYFRAGVWKPRSNPDSFAGIGQEALSWIEAVQQRFQTPACVEVMTADHVELCARHNIRALWIGARTAVNPATVQQLADAVRGGDFTILVKNPMVPDLKLWMGNITRFQKAGVRQVMAVHRGFPDNNENVYRNTPCWEIPIQLKVLFPELPILCDPSHICGQTQWIPQIAQIALNYGFDGLMVECHPNPADALSDAAQQLTPVAFGQMLANLTLRNTTTENHNLTCQRALLANIDNQLSELLYKRMQIVDEIAKIKQDHHLPVVQPHQWQQVVKRYIKPNQDEKYQNFIKDFLNLLHQASIQRQK